RARLRMGDRWGGSSDIERALEIDERRLGEVLLEQRPEWARVVLGVPRFELGERRHDVRFRSVAFARQDAAGDGARDWRKMREDFAAGVAVAMPSELLPQDGERIGDGDLLALRLSRRIGDGSHQVEAPV